MSPGLFLREEQKKSKWIGGIGLVVITPFPRRGFKAPCYSRVPNIGEAGPFTSSWDLLSVILAAMQFLLRKKAPYSTP